MSKGSRRRPIQISAEEEQRRWLLAFPPKLKEKEEDDRIHANHLSEGKALDRDAGEDA
jgi:hypothetical protein